MKRLVVLVLLLLLLPGAAFAAEDSWQGPETDAELASVPSVDDITVLALPRCYDPAPGEHVYTATDITFTNHGQVDAEIEWTSAGVYHTTSVPANGAVSFTDVAQYKFVWVRAEAVGQVIYNRTFDMSHCFPDGVPALDTWAVVCEDDERVLYVYDIPEGQYVVSVDPDGHFDDFDSQGDFDMRYPLGGPYDTDQTVSLSRVTYGIDGHVWTKVLSTEVGDCAPDDATNGTASDTSDDASAGTTDTALDAVVDVDVKSVDQTDASQVKATDVPRLPVTGGNALALVLTAIVLLSAGGVLLRRRLR